MAERAIFSRFLFRLKFGWLPSVQLQRTFYPFDSVGRSMIGWFVGDDGQHRMYTISTNPAVVNIIIMFTWSARGQMEAKTKMAVPPANRSTDVVTKAMRAHTHMDGEKIIVNGRTISIEIRRGIGRYYRSLIRIIFMTIFFSFPSRLVHVGNIIGERKNFRPANI